MNTSSIRLFYGFRSFYKWFSLIFVFLFWVGCGGGGTTAPGAGAGGGGPGGAAAPGGINLPAPTADLEGGPASQVNVCDTINGTLQGDVVRVSNVTDPSITPINATLDATGAFSLTICIQTGQTISVQVFDSAGMARSPAQSITRTNTEPFNICSPPSNPFPNCP